MKRNELNGFWTGYYALGPTYGHREYLKVPFFAKIKTGFWGFSGEIVEDVTNGGIDDHAIINGTLKGSEIRFKKKYAKYHYIDTDGTTKSRTDRDAALVMYTAPYDDKGQVFSGTWSIPEAKKNGLAGYGVWEMRKARFEREMYSEHLDLPDVRMNTDLEENFADLVFKIVEKNEDGAHHFFTVMGTYKGAVLGFKVGLPTLMGKGIDNTGVLVGSSLVHAGAGFYSIGPATVTFLEVMASLYGLKKSTVFIPASPTATIFPLNQFQTDLNTPGIYKLKLFFNDNTDKYAELYLNVDLENDLLELNEKDPAYRSNLLNSFCS